MCVCVCVRDSGANKEQLHGCETVPAVHVQVIESKVQKALADDFLDEPVGEQHGTLFTPAEAGTRE